MPLQPRERDANGKLRDPVRYSAGSKDKHVVERCLEKMEGMVQKLRDTKIHKRPKAMPVHWIAGNLGCTVATVNRWQVLHDRKRTKEELSERFCELYSLICDLLVARQQAKAFEIADNVRHPKAFDALKFLLPRIHPELFGESVRAELATEEQDADIPQEIFDALSGDARAELEAINERNEKDNARADELLREAAKRVASEDP